MTTYRRDIISSVVFGAGAITLYGYVSQYPVRANQPAAISAGFYPKILAAVLGVLAIVQLVTTIVKHRQAPATEQIRMWKDAASVKLFLITLTALIVYPFLMRLVGFSITGLAFLATLIIALSRDQRRGKHAWIIVAVTLGIGILTFVVFRQFLNIPFPRGILFER